MTQTRWATTEQKLAKKVQSLSEYIQVEEDPIEVLSAIRDLRDLLRDLENCAAWEAKSNGASLQTIADALGTSRQAVHERYSVTRLSERDYTNYLRRMDERRAAQVR